MRRLGAMLVTLVGFVVFVGLAALAAIALAEGELDDALLASGEARTPGLDLLR